VVTVVTSQTTSQRLSLQQRNNRKLLIVLVGTARFELATPCTPSKCATRLRHVPMKGYHISARQTERRTRVVARPCRDGTRVSGRL
jgi:hypothetical protein